MPVELFSVVLAALAHTAIRSLIAGETPDRAAWAEATTAVLRALLAERATTNETLERVEAKIESLRRDQFELPFKTGLGFLEQAQPPWREEEERKLLLADARRSFVQAAAAAPDDDASLLAEWYLALTWLLSRSPEDCRQHLRVAAGRGLAALVQAATWATDPPLEAVRKRAGTPELSLLDRMFLSRSAEGAANWEIRREALQYLLATQPLVAGVQLTRRQLGVAASESPVPRVSHGPEVESSGPEIVVQLEPGVPSVIGALTVCLHRVTLVPEAPGLHHFGPDKWDFGRIAYHRVDCELTLGLSSQTTVHEFEIALLDVANAAVRTTRAGLYYVPLPSRILAQQSAAWASYALFRSSPGPSLDELEQIESRSLGSERPALRLYPGQVERGALRLRSQGEPLAVEIRGHTGRLAHPSRAPFTADPRFVILVPINSPAEATQAGAGQTL
jgi:hypothetical protein